MANKTQAPHADLLSDQRYLNAVAKSCERLDRILSGSDTLTVQMDHNPETGMTSGMQVPAYQHFGNLYLVPGRIRDMVSDPADEDEVLPLLLALDLHELGHFEFSPRADNLNWRNADDNLIRQIQNDATHPAHLNPWAVTEHVRKALNGLEDQRLELLMTTRYPKARDYLRLASLHSMFKLNKRPNGIPAENYLLYYGRRFMLPRPILNRLRAQLVAKYDEAKVAEAESLITEYLTKNATDESDLTRMHSIAVRLVELFKIDHQVDTRSECFNVSQMGGRTSKRAQQKATEQGRKLLEAVDQHAKSQQTDENDANRSDRSDSKDAPKSDSKSDDGEEREIADGDESDEDDELDADSDSDDESDDDSDGDDEDDGEGDGIGADKALGAELGKMLERAYGKLASDTGERSEEIRVTMNGGAAQRLARLLREVSTDLKETDMSRLRSGKLDIRRIPAAIGPNADNQIFRQRRESLEPEAVMGTHIMVDVSGSMSQQWQIALDAGATIAKASELSGHFTRVSTFATHDETVIQWGQSADSMTKHPSNVGGGTNPLDLLENAYADFQATGKRLRFRNYAVVLITDGGFDRPEESAAAIAKLHAAGVSILLIGINTPVSGWTDYRTGTEHPFAADGHITISNVHELEPHMRAYLKKIAVQIARRVLRSQ